MSPLAKQKKHPDVHTGATYFFSTTRLARLMSKAGENAFLTAHAHHFANPEEKSAIAPRYGECSM
jgi:hypothetical protein